MSARTLLASSGFVVGLIAGCACSYFYLASSPKVVNSSRLSPPNQESQKSVEAPVGRIDDGLREQKLPEEDEFLVGSFLIKGEMNDGISVIRNARPSGLLLSADREVAYIAYDGIYLTLEIDAEGKASALRYMVNRGDPDSDWFTYVDTNFDGRWDEKLLRK